MYLCVNNQIIAAGEKYITLIMYNCRRVTTIIYFLGWLLMSKKVNPKVSSTRPRALPKPKDLKLSSASADVFICFLLFFCSFTWYPDSIVQISGICSIVTSIIKFFNCLGRRNMIWLSLGMLVLNFQNHHVSVRHVPLLIDSMIQDMMSLININPLHI